MGKLKKFIITLIFIIGIALLFQINNTYAKTGYITNNKLTYVTLENDEETLISGFEIGEKVSDVLKNFSKEYIVKIKNSQGIEITDEPETKIGTGYKIEIYNSQETLEKTFTIVVYGDTNEDGEIGAVDALAIIKNKLEVTMFQNKATEEAGRTNVETRNNDEIPKADDALLIIKHKLYEKEFPIEQRIIKATDEDYISPNISDVQTVVDGYKITVTAKVEDSASKNVNAEISKIKSTTYSIDGENYQDSNEFTVETPGSYTVYVKAIDNFDNETITSTIVTVQQSTLTIKHYLDNIEDNNFTYIKTTRVENIVNNTTITLLDYIETIENGVYSYASLTESVSGAESSAIETLEISNNTTICFYYKRNVYTVKVEKGDNITYVSGGGKCKAGGKVQINTRIVDGYVFSGWKIKEGTGNIENVNNINTAVTPTSDITVLAEARLENEIAQIGEKKYPSIQSAINSISDSSTKTTIQVLQSHTLNSNITNSNNVTLDLGGNTITTSNYYIRNSGTLEIDNGSINSSSSYNIYNEKTLILQSKARLENTDGYVVWNVNLSSILTINGAILKNYAENSRAISNYGTLTINSGEIISEGSLGCISNKTNATTLIYGGTVDGRNAIGGAIYNDTDSTLTIGKSTQTNINIYGTNNGEEHKSALYNTGGNITIENGNIYGYNSNTINQVNGSLTINGGVITSTDSSYPTIWITEGTMLMTGGTITNSGGGYTIYNENGTVTKTGGTAENTHGAIN